MVKKTFLDRVGYNFGSAIGSYQEGLKAHLGQPVRPEHLNALAKGERWRGGTSPEKYAAQLSAAQNTWVYTAINERGKSVAGTGYDIIYNPSKIEDEGEVLPNHPAKTLLKNPNPYMGGSYLWYYSQWWADLDGNFFWLVLPDAQNNPAEIWPLPSSDITIETGDNQNVIDNYLYEPANWGGQFDIDPYYMFHFRYPNPFNYFRGMSPLVAALLPAQSDTAMARWNGSFFGQNNTMPSAIINVSSGVPGKLIDQIDIDAIQESLKSSYAATERKTVVTGAYDLDVELLTYNAKDMDFLAGRQFTKEEIFTAYGIPPGMLDKDATMANANVGKEVFMENTMHSLLTLLDEELTTQFMVKYYGENLELRHEDVRPENKEFKLNEAGTHGGYLTIDEYRADYLDKDPLPDGRGANRLDEQATPQNVTSVEAGIVDEIVGSDVEVTKDNQGVTAGVNVKSATNVKLVGVGEYKKDYLPYTMLKDLTSNKGQRTNEKLEILRNIIKKHGITKSIWVKRRDNGVLEIVDGKHRVDFAGEFNIEQIPVVAINDKGEKIDPEVLYREWLADGATNEVVEVETVETKSVNQKAIDDLMLYRKKSLGYLKRDNTPIVNRFTSEYLSPKLVVAISNDLGQVKTPSGVKSVFGYYEEWLRGDTLNV